MLENKLNDEKKLKKKCLKVANEIILNIFRQPLLQQN